MKKTFTIFFLLFISASPVMAQSDEAKSDHVMGRLQSAYEGVGKHDSIDMGVTLDFEPDWYSYWRMPGDSGLAPSFDWTGSENVKSVAISWPAPKRFTALDLYSFGYDKHVTLPLSVVPAVAGAPVRVNLKLDLVVCHDICIPATLTMVKNIGGGDAIKTNDYELLRTVRKMLPSLENTKNLGMETAALGQNAVVVGAYAKGGFGGVDMIIEVPGITMATPPVIIADEKDTDKALIKITAPEGYNLAQALFGKTARITLIKGAEAVERDFNF